VLLVALTYVWANLHGLWFLAVGLTGLAAIGALLDHGRPGLRQAATLAGTAVAMVVAAALTPNGPRLLLSPFHVREYAKFGANGNPERPLNLGLRVLRPPGAADRRCGRRREPVPPSQLLVICAAIFLGLSYVRTLAPAAVLLVPHVAALWQPASGRAVDAGKRSDRGMHRLGSRRGALRGGGDGRRPRTVTP
jgi:hypothetical protein